jgi:hypothetical protein
VTADLLERDRELKTLNTPLDTVTSRQGRVAVIAGEAGIGKTALVEYFMLPDMIRSTTLFHLRFIGDLSAPRNVRS